MRSWLSDAESFKGWKESLGAFRALPGAGGQCQAQLASPACPELSQAPYQVIMGSWGWSQHDHKGQRDLPAGRQSCQTHPHGVWPPSTPTCHVLMSHLAEGQPCLTSPGHFSGEHTARQWGSSRPVRGMGQCGLGTAVPSSSPDWLCWFGGHLLSLQVGRYVCVCVHECTCVCT